MSLAAMLPLFNAGSAGHQTPSLPLLPTGLRYFLPLITIHLALVKTFRRHFIRQLYRKHPYASNPTGSQKPLSEMPLAAAHDVIKLISGKDFPYMFSLALQLALVRVYAIPTISQLLVKTAQLSSTSRNIVGKRYADTTVIISELYHNAPGSPHSSEAFARLNYLHGHYIRQSRISNDDMLYTLSMFMRSPSQWINRYEWRQLTELEIAGLGLFHRFMGEAMEISFDVLDDWPPPPLPNHQPAAAADDDTKVATSTPRTWRTDGLAFYGSLDAWSQDYETRNMLPAESNHSTTLKTLQLLTSTLPPFLSTFAVNMAISMMDTRMRLACQLPAPPGLYRATIDCVLALRAFYLNHLALPRRSIWGWWTPESERGLNTAVPDPHTGRRHLKDYDALPHYVKPTVWNRWLSPRAWSALCLGLPRPGDEGMEGRGWLPLEVGPKAFVGKGAAEFSKERERLMGNVEVVRPVGAEGCPVFVRSR